MDRRQFVEKLSLRAVGGLTVISMVSLMPTITTPRYVNAAAELAWERTIAFFNEHKVT